MNKQRAAYTRSRTIRVKGDKIYFYLKNDGQLDVMTYNEDLHRLLTDQRLSPFRDADGRLSFTLYLHGLPYHKYRIPDLAFGCYNGLVHYDSFVEDMQKYLNGKVGLAIDHADSNAHNNTKNNLSLMESELNRAKGVITARVKLPNGIVTAFVNGRYRIEFVAAITDYFTSVNEHLVKIGSPYLFVPTGREKAIERYLCDTPEDFVDCLKWIITTSREWTDTIKTQGKYINRDNPCYSDCLDEAIKEQERVAAYPVEAFQIWETKQ